MLSLKEWMCKGERFISQCKAYKYWYRTKVVTSFLYALGKCYGTKNKNKSYVSYLIRTEATFQWRKPILRPNLYIEQRKKQQSKNEIDCKCIVTREKNMPHRNFVYFKALHWFEWLTLKRKIVAHRKHASNHVNYNWQFTNMTISIYQTPNSLVQSIYDTFSAIVCARLAFRLLF